MVIGRDPGQYGFEPGQAVMPEVDRVTVPASTDLRKLAASTGIPLQTLRSLNAVLVRGVTPPGRTWEVRVPSGTREAFVTALTPRMKVATVATVAAPSRLAASTAVHVVRARDTVSSIAKLYGVSTSDVVRWNNLENGDAIRPGDRLRVTTRGALGAGLLDRRIDLGTHQQGQAAAVEPEHQEYQAADRAVGRVVIVEISDVEPEAERHQEPRDDREGRARRDPGPGAIRGRGQVVDERQPRQSQKNHYGQLEHLPDQCEQRAEPHEAADRLAEPGPKNQQEERGQREE